MDDKKDEIAKCHSEMDQMAGKIKELLGETDDLRGKEMTQKRVEVVKLQVFFHFKRPPP